MIIVTNEILIIGVLFPMLPRAEEEVIHCRRDIDCVLFMKHCPYSRACNSQGICVCF